MRVLFSLSFFFSLVFTFSTVHFSYLGVSVRESGAWGLVIHARVNHASGRLSTAIEQRRRCCRRAVEPFTTNRLSPLFTSVASTTALLLS